jgi:molybdopterin molybdotransferase
LLGGGGQNPQIAMAASPLITVAEARERVLAEVRPLSEEQVPVDLALGRVLSRDVVAKGDVPPFACSAMDGYAVTAGPSGRRLEIVGESRAGAPSDRALGEHDAIRISTGAAVPAGATAVIRQEDVRENEDHIETQAMVVDSDNVRGVGEDQRTGERVLEAGTTLATAELGAVVAAGLATVTVGRRARVAIICTGDELRAPGDELGPGEIHNSNAVMLASLATRCGAIPEPPERVRDDRATIEAALAAALARADVLVVSGGVSVGPHDHVKPAFASLSVQERFWRVGLQPGKPTWFGTRDEQLVFGLPGNPVSAVVTFALFVAPALRALQGAAALDPEVPEARLGAAVKRNPQREQALRVRLEQRDGHTIATPTGPQGSHLVSSLVGADALALIPRGDDDLPAGERVVLERLP